MTSVIPDQWVSACRLASRQGIRLQLSARSAHAHGLLHVCTASPGVRIANFTSATARRSCQPDARQPPRFLSRVAATALLKQRPRAAWREPTSPSTSTRPKLKLSAASSGDVQPFRRAGQRSSCRRIQPALMGTSVPKYCRALSRKKSTLHLLDLSCQISHTAPPCTATPIITERLAC